MTRNLSANSFEQDIKTQETRKLRVASLIELSLNGLAKLYDEKQGLFAFYVKYGKRLPMPLGWSICYTAITLLGLHKVGPSEQQKLPGFDEKAVLSSLVAHWKHSDKFGHLGLIQWANAECGGQYAKDVTDKIAKKSSQDYLVKTPTTELAWLLTGICATYQHFQADEYLRELAFKYFRVLTDNFNPQTGLFCHRRAKTDIRSDIGNFADQIYSVFALASFYEVFNERRALMQSEQCADSLCAMQGEQGQWWWHYHSRHGSVAFPYPVFSVHQDGMGPMGLRKLSMVSGKSFENSIHRGLNWLFGHNELGVEMVDWSQNLIWRDIEPAPLTSTLPYLSILLAETGLINRVYTENPTYNLRLNYEIRPYELGWLLYAFTGPS